MLDTPIRTPVATVSRFLLLLIALALPFSAAAADSGNPADEAELARAASLRDQAKSLREGADADYETQQAGCGKEVLVNRCIAKAKEARIATIRKARAMEIEASHIETGQKRRAAAETGRSKTDAPLAPAAPTEPGEQALPADPAVTTTRQEREANAAKAAADLRAAQKLKDAEKARQRAKADAEAAKRAAAAREDRERYERRQRKNQEEKAGQ